MPFNFDPGALLGRTYPLEDGSRVRLRLARSSDAAAVRTLLRRQADLAEQTVPDLELARLVSFDPRDRCVICATGLIEGAERLIGVGSIPLDGDGAEPEWLIIDPASPPGLRSLLIGALVGRASALGRDRAA